MVAAAVLVGCAGRPTQSQPEPPASAAPLDAGPLEQEEAQRQAQVHADRVAAAMADRTSAVSPITPEGDPVLPQVQWLDERPMTQAVHAAPTPAAAPAAAVVVQPVPETPVAAPAPAPPSRDDLAAQLLTTIRQSDDPAVARAVAAAALSVAQHQATLDPRDLEGLTDAQKEAVKQYHALLSAAAQRLVSGQPLPTPSQTDVAQPQGPLAIRHVALCRNVRSYGVYEPFDSQTFLAGREQPMIVYVELDQFQTQKLEDGQLEVRLHQEIELYNEADGLAVWKQPPVQIVDQSRNRRRDFFVVQLIRLPARLGVGKYLLKVRVSDKHGGSIDETTVPIQLVADQSLVKQ